jgi:hypothetical protein
MTNTATTTNQPGRITLPVTVRGETRQISFDQLGSHYLSAAVFAARIGNGAKLYRASVAAWPYTGLDEAAHRGYRGSSVVEVDGRVYGIQMKATILNRQAGIVAWADRAEGTLVGSKRNDYTSLA